MKRIICMLLCAVVALGMVGCADTAKPESGTASGMVEVPNPFRTCKDLNEAAAKTGFSLRLPSEPERVAVMSDTMIEAVLADGSCIRKAAGDGDISGDYNAYAQVETVDGVTLKGENDGFRLALWTAAGYTYCVSCSESMAQSELLELVERIS